MTFQRHIEKVSRRLVGLIMAACIFSVMALALALHQFNALSFSESDSESLHSTVAGSDDVVGYLEEEKENEAHFVTIATLVKQDQQRSLARALVVITVPLVITAAVIGYIVARQVLRPVKSAYESQERFLQDAAHELRNPLAAMSLSLQNADQTSDKQLVSTMTRQTDRLIRISEDLLYLERQAETESAQVVDASDLLGDVLEDFQPAASARSITFDSQIDPGIKLKMVTSDFIKITRNIIENAIKYSPDGGRIDVHLKTGKAVSLVVMDRGIGIAKGDLSKLGQRFFRAESSGDTPGSGLGLAIVHKALNLYGGEIDIDSDLGSGTTVRIKLPSAR